MVSPSQKKLAVAHVVQQQLCSVRRACIYLGLPRSTYRYVAKPLTDRQEQLYQRILALSWHHPRYGYRRIRALLAREGWMVSRKQVQRIRRREGDNLVKNNFSWFGKCYNLNKKQFKKPLGNDEFLKSVN